MPNKAKNSTFLPNFPIFHLIGHVIKKISKTHKNEKPNIKGIILSPKGNSKLIFRIFVLLLAYFEQKVAKNMLFFVFVLFCFMKFNKVSILSFC